MMSVDFSSVSHHAGGYYSLYFNQKLLYLEVTSSDQPQKKPCLTVASDRAVSGHQTWYERVTLSERFPMWKLFVHPRSPVSSVDFQPGAFSG